MAVWAAAFLKRYGKTYFPHGKDDERFSKIFSTLGAEDFAERVGVFFSDTHKDFETGKDLKHPSWLFAAKVNESVAAKPAAASTSTGSTGGSSRTIVNDKKLK